MTEPPLIPSTPSAAPTTIASAPVRRRSPAAAAVAAGIFLSRIAGLVRERVFAHYLGNSDAAGAFKAALRIPNLLQNLFGEGVLSASLIPVYARLLAEGNEEEADRVAGTVFALLALVVSVIVALGVEYSRQLIDILAPGFTGEVRTLTIRLVAIMFPATGLLVLSAWCLGILNSHRRFFLSYVAPVLWNLTIIGVLLVGGRQAHSGDFQSRLVEWVAWGTVGGAALQFLVQLPRAIRLNRGLRLSLDVRRASVRTVIHNFVPAILSRGVVQLSAYIDQVLASFLGAQAVSAMAYAQTIYLLPVSLFGMAISSAELPEMSSALGSADQVAAILQARLAKGLQRISFFIVPSAVAFLALGDVVVATLFQTGQFHVSDSRFVWFILAGSTVGLLATTQARLCTSTFWALHDTKTPAIFAFIRVILTGILGYLVTFPLRAHFGWPPILSAAGLTASAGIAGWLEFFLIYRALRTRIGSFSLGGKITLRLWAGALLAAVVAVGIKLLFPPHHPLLRGVVVLGTYGALYVAFALKAGGDDAREILLPVLRRLGLKR